MHDMNDSDYKKSKDAFLSLLESIKTKAASEHSLSPQECLILLAGELLTKSTRQEQGYR